MTLTDLPPANAAAHAQPTPWWLWPHVLSLEAPLVAVLWQRALAHAHGIRLTPMLDAGLALACWVIYVIDRTLDTLAANNLGELDVRHAFYHRHRRLLMLGVLPPALMLLAWMAFYVIPEGVLWQAAGLSLLVVLYLASWPASREAHHSCGGLRRLLPKEMAAALLFALGCTTSTRFFATPDHWLDPVFESGLLTLLFACNLHGISCRENEIPGRRHSPLMFGTLIFLLGVLGMIELGVLGHVLHGPTRAALAALLLQALVHGARRRLSVDAYRVLADLALILPLPLVWR